MSTTTIFKTNINFDLPVISISTNPEYLFDDTIGITQGITVNDSVGADPPFDPDANFWYDWERPICLEYYTEDGLNGFSVDAGIQVFGGAFGRQIPQKAFTIFMRDSYGADKIYYPLFKSKDLEQFERFILRASSNDYNRTFLRDAMMTTLVVNRMDIDYQAYQPVLGFINGDFWGLYNVREKMNEYYPQINYGIDKDNVDLLERAGEVTNGSGEHYTNLINYIKTNDITNDQVYKYVQSQMDVNEYMNYMIVQIYFRNHDWPVNNIKYWRDNQSNGRWRWMLFDLDWGFGGESREGGTQYKTNTLDWVMNLGEVTILFTTLLKNQQFKNEFVQRFFSHLNTTFKPGRVIHIIDSLAENIAPYMPMHIERWHIPTSISQWDSELDTLRDFAIHRQEYIQNHLVETFELDDMVPLEVHVDPPKSGKLKIYTVEPLENAYWGYMAKGLPVKIIAEANAGYQFKNWEGSQLTSSDTLIFTLQDTSVLFARFESVISSMIVINEIHYNPSKSLQGSDDDYEFLEIYNAGNGDADLSGYYFDRGITFIFPENTHLAAGEYMILANNKVTYQNEDISVYEFQAGRLANEGEAIVLCNSSGSVIDSVNYSDGLPWPLTPDGDGPSLVLIDPLKSNTIANNWKASEMIGGTPGYDNFSTSVSNNNSAPKRYYLYQNYPNPFNHQTQIQFDLPKDAFVEVVILNALGQHVTTLISGEYKAGSVNVCWTGYDKYDNVLPSGMYFYRITTDKGFKSTKKMILMK